MLYEVITGATAILVSIIGRNVKPHVVHRFNEMEKVMNQDAG